MIPRRCGYDARMSDNLPATTDQDEKPEWYRPPSGIPASGMPANGKWDDFTPGPDGTGKAANEVAQELGRQRKELARHSYNSVHEATAKRIASLQVQALDAIEERFRKKEISADVMLVQLREFEVTLNRLMGRPSTHTEGQLEVNIVSKLKELAKRG